jgi:hypothetical protein
VSGDQEGALAEFRAACGAWEKVGNKAAVLARANWITTAARLGRYPEAEDLATDQLDAELPDLWRGVSHLQRAWARAGLATDRPGCDADLRAAMPLLRGVQLDPRELADIAERLARAAHLAGWPDLAATAWRFAGTTWDSLDQPQPAEAARAAAKALSPS